MRLIKQYALVYREYLSNCFAEAMSYRLHFFLLIIMDLLFYASVLGSVEFLFQHVDHIGLWNRTQFMLFLSFMLAIEHLHMTFISENFWNFSFDIRTGRLDFILLKPIATPFVVFFKVMRPGTLINALFPWGYLIYFGNQLHFVLWQWLCLPLLVLAGLTLLTAIEILISMSMFWIIESFGVNLLRLQLQQISRWPEFIFQGPSRLIFGLLMPVLVVGSAPVQFLLDPHQWPGLVKMAALIVLACYLTALAWRKGLASYESASS